MDWNQVLNGLLNMLIDWAKTSGVRILIALALLFISFKIVNSVSRKIQKSGENGRIDKTLARTFAYIFKIAMKGLIAICLIGYVGIDTSGLAALVVSFVLV